MRLHRRSLLAALAALPVAAAARADDSAADTALEAVFSAVGPPALAGGIVTREGLAWSGVRGVRKAGGRDAVTAADRWHLGSNTKAMTAALFARLVEQGRADWDLDIAGAFPDVPIDLAWRDVYLRDLMHHRAGLIDADVIGREWLMTARDDPRSLPEQRAALTAKALGKPPSGVPGDFVYGNANYILVGAAIERLTGRSWEDAMRTEVFGPLGLSSGGFGPPADPNAWGHRAGPTPMDPASPGADNPLALGPAGTAHMTLVDYARFIRVFLKDGDGWLKPESIARLTTPATGEGPAYACGWGVRTQAWAGENGAGPVLAHEGSNTMWHALAAVAPQRGMAFITVSNDDQTGRAATQGLVQRLVALAAV